MHSEKISPILYSFPFFRSQFAQMESSPLRKNGIRFWILSIGPIFGKHVQEHVNFLLFMLYRSLINTEGLFPDGMALTNFFFYFAGQMTDRLIRCIVIMSKTLHDKLDWYCCASVFQIEKAILVLYNGKKRIFYHNVNFNFPSELLAKWGVKCFSVEISCGWRNKCMVGFVSNDE